MDGNLRPRIPLLCVRGRGGQAVGSAMQCSGPDPRGISSAENECVGYRWGGGVDQRSESRCFPPLFSLESPHLPRLACTAAALHPACPRASDPFLLSIPHTPYSHGSGRQLPLRLSFLYQAVGDPCHALHAGQEGVFSPLHRRLLSFIPRHGLSTRARQVDGQHGLRRIQRKPVVR